MSQPVQAPGDEQLDQPTAEERAAPWWQALVAGSSTWIGLILVALIVVFSLINSTDFFSASNARNIGSDAAVLLILATGLTYVIITAGIDLSVGSVLVFAGVAAAKLMNAVGGQGWGTILIGLVVALVGGVVLAQTRFGRYTYTTGSNLEGTRRAGVNVDLHLIKVYSLMGLLAGLAGFMSLARFSTTTIGGHDTDNLQAIAAVVIGGTSLFGGIGTMLGTVFGVFIPAVLQNGFVIVGVQPFWQQIAVGAVLIGAVYLDQLRRRSQYQR